MRSTMAGRAPATTSGTFVFTCATTGREPIAAASKAARTARRSDVVKSSTSAPFPLTQHFQSDGMFRILLQQLFEHGDPLFRTAGAEVNLRQRYVGCLVFWRPLQNAL